MRKLKNRVAIVTGASRGLGPYIARALNAEGMRLVLAARSFEELERQAEEIRANGGDAIAVQADVTAAPDREALVDAARSSFGRVDVLINNAGIEETGHFDHLADDDIARVIQVNLISAMQLARLVTPIMLKQKSGHIVNMASLAGKVPVPYSVPYAASKAGLIGFTESFRAEFGKRGVSASVICPGLVSDAGMYQDMKDLAHIKENFLAGTVTPAKVASDVVKAIKKNRPEMLVYRGPGRIVSGLAELAPGLFERTFPLFGTYGLFRDVADEREKSGG
ncbi:MAG: SDR family NAD(P)-dependent oxidoreductase [Dehalococcoidia bacterium]